MAIGKTLVLIKSDGVRMGYEIPITKRYTDAGLKIIERHQILFTEEDAALFYRDHVGKFYFIGLIFAMSCGRPCVALILEGENAMEEVRRLNGPTDPSKAPEGTIRCDFRSAGGPFNTVHASDKLTSFVHEYNVLTLMLSRYVK